jgi:hypothetical protein
MWERLDDPKVGERREVQLRQLLWNNFIEKGSGVDRLRTSTPGEAWRIVTGLISRPEERQAMLLQEEVVDMGLNWTETEAARLLYAQLNKLVANQKKTLERLLTQVVKSSDPELKKELESEFNKIQQQFDSDYSEFSSMEISLGRRARLLFSGNKSHAVSQVYPVDLSKPSKSANSTINVDALKADAYVQYVLLPMLSCVSCDSVIMPALLSRVPCSVYNINLVYFICSIPAPAQ